MSFIFIEIETATLLHSQSIEAFGGSQGIRDEGALESALQAPQFRAFYEDASLAICAATYAYHLTLAHAFVDGNKRVAAGASLLFIRLNQAIITATWEELYDLIMGIASQTTSREEVETFFVERVRLKAG